MADIDAQLLTGEEVIFQTKKHWFAPVADSKWDLHGHFCRTSSPISASAWMRAGPGLTKA